MYRECCPTVSSPPTFHLLEGRDTAAAMTYRDERLIIRKAARAAEYALGRSRDCGLGARCRSPRYGVVRDSWPTRDFAVARIGGCCFLILPLSLSSMSLAIQRPSPRPLGAASAFRPLAAPAGAGLAGPAWERRVRGPPPPPRPVALPGRGCPA